MSKKFLLWLLGFIVTGTIAACNLLNPGPTPTPTPNLSAKEIVSRSSQAMLAPKTLHFTIDLTGALDYIDRPPTTALKHVNGDLLRPDKVRGLVKVSSLGVITEIGLISIEGTSYVTNPVNQQWELLPPEWGWYFDPRLPFDEQYGIPSIIPHLTLEKKGVVEIEGHTYYHFEGMAQGEQITWWTAGMVASGDVPVQIWIDTDTFLIHRVHLIELSSDPERPTEWDIQFSDFNQALEIQAPPLDVEP
ncbi:MAG: LppX_LprAFG lipoprotein [Anaerolineae bacterium]|nr:LppX_LprAFG lipoprotein [Anaerolineae bacterium]